MANYYFGLNINRNLAEVSDKIESLKNLNLDIRDLNKIRNISVDGVQKTDLKTLSGLDFDAEKVSYSLLDEVSFYEGLSADVYDKYSYITTNINTRGSLGAAAYKYNYVDFSTNTIKKADVSTSRVSSWSTLESPVNNTTPIFYGGNVIVQGPIEVSNLVFTDLITPKKYDAEIPTHRIKTTINGEDVYLYAMKGIPLIFNGFFNTATVNASVTQIPNNTGIRPTWVIKDSNPNSTATPFEYINVLNASNISAINFRSVSSLNRTIEFYYPPDYITVLNLPKINLIDFPKTNLANLTNLNISSNNFREMPDFSGFTKLRTLNISYNNLTRSVNTNLTTFSQAVANRLPSTLTSLTMGHTYGRTITANLQPFGLVNLNLSASSRQDRLFTGVTPAVNSSTIETYNMSINAFNSISNTVLDSTSLKNIFVDNNILTQNNVNFISENLESINISAIGGSVNLINVGNKTKLISYIFSSVPINESNILYPNNIKSIFNGCNSLQSINIRSSNVKGNFPDLIGCNSLRNIDFINTNVGNFNTDFVLANSTFSDCKNSLQTLFWESSDITLRPIESGTFKNMFNLSQLYISSRSAGLNGTITSSMFSDCKNLAWLWMHNNNLEGSVPNFDNNNNLFYLYLPSNKFTGEVPNINKPNFRYLYLQFNNLTTFNQINSTRLLVLHLANNLLTNIPDLSNLTQLQELYLNNNDISTYTAGAFAKMTSVRNINLNGNRLTQGAVDRILLDLNTNFNSSRRRGVAVNLRGTNNSPPSNTKEIRDIILKLNSSGWNIVTN